MKVLNKDELQVAEGVLLKHLPKSYKVYGFLFSINRKKPSALEVLVDAWPDFKIIICRPDLKNKQAMEQENKVTCYSMDGLILRKMLSEKNVLDWSMYFIVGGFDISNAPILQEVSSDKEVNNRCILLTQLLYLADSSSLIPFTVDSELESRISSLSLFHVELVNKTWKFGGNEKSLNKIKNLVCNFPSYCITDEQSQPVSWILVYDYCAMGFLYTLPEHRGRGYAKVLVSTMAKRLHAEGYPVYCFIEEENFVSYRLFKSLGFIEDPTYRTGWFDFNF